MPFLFEYQLLDKDFVITPVKLIIAILFMIFSLLELLPRAQKIQFNRKNLALGGASVNLLVAIFLIDGQFYIILYSCMMLIYSSINYNELIISG